MARLSSKMAHDHCLEVPHCGEVVGAVPLDQQRQVGQQAVMLDR